MNDAKYIGLDVHQATISATVLDSTGKLVMEVVLETKAATLLEFIHGLRGSLRVTFEEGTCAAWLHDLLKPHVTEVLVCNPRKNALLKVGNKSDRIDARKLAELLYLNKLSSVYHGENGVRALKELARSYLTVTKDLSQVMNRLKAVYRSWAIPCAGKLVYSPQHRAEWLQKLPEAGVRRRAERLYQQLDALRSLRQAGTAGREPETSCSWIATTDSLHRPYPSGAVDRTDSDSSSFPHQAATSGLQRPGPGHSDQCRISFPGWATPAFQKNAGRSWTQR